MKQSNIGLGEEFVGPDEAAIIDEIIQMNIAMLKEGEAPSRRAQHPKHHGCVEAEFEILPNIPEHFQHGIFKQKGPFKALIRFSNGTSDYDSKPDAHGMAIKLLKVGGKKLLEGQEDSTTHDFILIDHPNFFSSTLEEYRVFNRFVGRIVAAQRNAGRLIRLAATGWNFVNLLARNPGIVVRVRKFTSQTPSSPLATHYWSTTPYDLGPGQPVKYIAVSNLADRPGAQDGVDSPGGLGDALRADLNGDVEFTFGVHEQKDPVRHPVKDATVPWWPEDDPGGLKSFVRLARIHKLKLAENSDFLAENLVFSHFNVLEAHRPLGVINRVRDAVYRKLAEIRHGHNTPEGIPHPGSVEVPEG